MLCNLDRARAEMSVGRFRDALTAIAVRSESQTSSHLDEQILIAEALQLTGEGKQATALAKAGLRSKLRSDLTDAKCLAVLGLVAFERGNNTETLRLLQRAQRAAERADDLKQACRIQLDLIANLSDWSGPNSIAAKLKDCENSICTLGDVHLEARLHITIGQVEGKRGLLEQAEEHLRIAEALLLTSPNATRTNQYNN